MMIIVTAATFAIVLTRNNIPTLIGNWIIGIAQDTAYVLWPVQHLYVFPGDVHVGFSSSGYSYPHFGTGCNGHRH